MTLGLLHNCVIAVEDARLVIQKLERERVVCVRVTREATVQRPVLGGAPPAEGEGDAASKKPGGAAPALDR